MLLKQSPAEIDLVTDLFYLTAGEKELLLSANVGEGLFFAGQSHVAMQVIAAPFEHEMITTNPSDKDIKPKEEEELVEEPEIEIKPVELPDPMPENAPYPNITSD
jgi:hypothetical protein